MGTETFNPQWAVRDARNPALTFAHKAVLYALASRLRHAEDEAYPATETLAGDAGGSDRQTRTIVGELVTWGILHKRSVVDARGRHNQYRIDFEMLARIERFEAPVRRRRPPPAWRGSGSAPPPGFGSPPPEGSGNAPPEGSGNPPPMGSGNPPPAGSGSAPPKKIQEEVNNGRDEYKHAEGAPPSASPPRRSEVPEFAVNESTVGRAVPGDGEMRSLPCLAPPPSFAPARDTSPAPLVLELVPATGVRKPIKHAAKSARDAPIPEGYHKLVDTYHQAWMATKGPDAPFPWGKREGDAAKKLLAGHGLEVALAALAGAEVNPSWNGSFFAIANDPARWIAGAASTFGTLTAQQAEQASAIMAANPDHPVAQTLRAASQRTGLRNPVPSRRQFEWLVSDPDAGRRNRQHAPQKDAAFDVHEAWRG